MKRLGSVLAGVFIVTLFGVALVGLGCSDDDSPTGGGTTEGTVAVPLLVAEVVCPDSYADTLTDRVAGDLRFISVHGGHFQTMHFESSGNIEMYVAPGEYEVRVHSRRCSSEVIMPGTVVVSEAGSLVVQHQAAAGTLPAMSVVDGTLNLINLATIFDPDTMAVTFRYMRDEEGLSPSEEITLINQLNDATGRRIDVKNMRRVVIDWYPVEFPFVEIRYTMSVDDGLYLTDFVEACRQYMVAHSETYPQSMLVDAGFMMPCMYIIDYDPGGIILD